MLSTVNYILHYIINEQLEVEDKINSNVPFTSVQIVSLSDSL